MTRESLPCRRCRAMNRSDADRCHACGTWLPHSPVWGMAIVLIAIALIAAVGALLRR